ncbi:hypothetical protein COCNU_scaffold002289G000010 [Cocos nucifera]|nr:hypothetical protein [Cocos nucifera]
MLGLVVLLALVRQEGVTKRWKEKFFFMYCPTLMLGLPPWGLLRESIHQAPSLDRNDLDSTNKLKTYQAPLLLKLLKEHTLFNVGLSPLNLAEMDTKVVEMLTKGLHAWNRKGKASNKSSKRASVDALSFATPTATIIASEVSKAQKLSLSLRLVLLNGALCLQHPQALQSKIKLRSLSSKERKEGRRKRRRSSRRCFTRLILISPTTTAMIWEKTPLANRRSSRT